jgi:acetolactate synthase-1/2/3 large subunit
MLTDQADVPDAPAFQPVETSPGPEDLAQLQSLLAEAKRPLLLLGGSRWSAEACASMATFAERFEIPVITSYRRLPLFDSHHPLYAGDLGIGPNPVLIARIKACDLLIVAGGRLGDIPTQGYALFDIPAPATRIVHIHAAAEELGRVFVPHLAINATPRRFAPALAALEPTSKPAWTGSAPLANAEYRTWTGEATPQPGGVNFGAILVWLRNSIPSDTILCNGAGNFAAWIHRFYRFRQFATHIAPAAGAMGYGVPAAVAMKRLYPNRDVLCIAGDGDFLMNGQEFATAVQYDLPFITVICDNGLYGTIRMHQEREYPGRVLATVLRNPDFAAYAQAFGGFGITVERTDQFAEAYGLAKASGKPAIIHLKIDPDAILPGTTLTRIREQAFKVAS